jgi:predicted flavoprotein YhiN
LFSFKINDGNLTDLSGLSTETSRVKLLVSKRFSSENKELLKQNLIPMLTQTGPILITHQGLSGPGILKLSAYGARIMAELKYRFEIEIAWICSVTHDELISRFQREKTDFPNR